MTIYNIIISSIIILNGIGVILSKNTITAIINLIAVFIWSAINVIIIGAEFFWDNINYSICRCNNDIIFICYNDVKFENSRNI